MRTILAFFIATLAVPALAQNHVTQKIGYADTEYIFSQMPEFKQVDVDLKAHGTQLQTQMETKQKELETKYKAYQAMPATTPDAIRADKERELTQLQSGLQQFQQDAQASFEKKRATLMEPLFAKVADAISAVAKEHAYTFIINPGLMGGGGDILLYTDEKYDISKDVLKKLGVTPSAAVTTPPKTN
jgi:outer membrane protein